MEDQKSQSLTILYGTETGHAESIAHKMESEARSMGIDARRRNMADFDIDHFKEVQNLAVIVSTHGIGEPPIASERLFYKLESEPSFSLETIRYSVLALGDTEYALFCQAGKDFDLLLRKHGAQFIIPRVDCDVDFEWDAMNWIAEFLGAIKALS
ncbi:MAG: flavodoxin domain-containing protein [Cyclobacteriaceae bacterium]